MDACLHLICFNFNTVWIFQPQHLTEIGKKKTGKFQTGIGKSETNNFIFLRL